MKTFVAQLPRRQKLELLIWSAVLTIALCLIAMDAIDNIAKGYAPNRRLFLKNQVRFLYFRDYFYPVVARYAVLFFGFLILNFWVFPKFYVDDRKTRPGWWLVGSFLLFTLLLACSYGLYKSYLLSPFAGREYWVQSVLQSAFLAAGVLFAGTGLYHLVKNTVLYVIRHAPELEARYTFINREGLLAFVVWFVSLLLLVVSHAERGAIVAWTVVGPTAILFYWAALAWLIPSVVQKRRALLHYLFRTILLLAFVVLIGSLFLLLLVQEEHAAFPIAFFNGMFQLFVTAPLSWIVYKQKQKGKREISTLKNALGQRTAHFDFLRSQINPHFLFNALNTLYGTALQESADRTAEGVERLSSMMRFMLQENVQEKIALTREIEYLNNYIALQRLRTGPHENIQIEVAIEDEGAERFYIAPMLLIPFVENAFKHGISFRSPSFIRISLEIRGNEMYFDVVNSRHAKQENDPEKANNGIGLTNVKERLQLLYPGNHDLSIRETAKQFFVHLTLQLRNA